MPARMPALFLGHGSPRITFQDNDVTRAWRRLAATLERPRAILVVSAHWSINASAVTAMERPRTVHDFFYAPDELYAFEYRAPGSPALAEHLVDVVAPTWLGLDVDSWGLDHGAWSLLAHLYPAADVPVLQLSVHAAATPAYHLELGRSLAPLRDEGVLVLASGNVLHNGAIYTDAGRSSGDYDRALAFEREVATVMTVAPEQAAKLCDHPDYRLAAPTDDHFVPLLYLAGLATEAGAPCTVALDGPGLGTPGMTGYALGR